MKNSAVPLTKDKPVILLVTLSGVLAFINVVITAARLRSHDFKVPVQYVVNDGSVLQTSSWYTLYSLALFSVAGAFVVVFLAHRVYKANKVFALGILTVYVVIQVFTILVTNALLGLVGRV